MNNLRLFVVVALAAFLVACASTVAIPSQAYAPPPKSALATVYVLRFNSMPLKANIQVGVDGKTLMLLPDNRYTWFQVPAGPRVLSAQDRARHLPRYDRKAAARFGRGSNVRLALFDR